MKKDNLHFGRSSARSQLSSKIFNLDGLMERLNNRLLNPAGTRLHQDRQQVDLAAKARSNVRKSVRSKYNGFQLSQKQLIAQASSLFSKIGKRYL